MNKGNVSIKNIKIIIIKKDIKNITPFFLWGGGGPQKFFGDFFFLWWVLEINPSERQGVTI